MARHFAIRGFWELYRKLPDDVRLAADKSYVLLKVAPDHPSLRFKRVGAAYSARVGLHYRALARHRGGDFYWFWIGTHADYDALLRKG